MGCPAMHRWEMREAHKSHRDRLASIKSTLDTRPPAAQPHLTLYGRDYAQKKKATTEAAFSDLKMIQAIARTMTRKHEVAERKGPVSLNADARKAEIFRVMNENHRLLEHIDNVGAFCSTQELVAEHRFKQRYVINASHTSRLSGEYDDEMGRIKREQRHKFETQQRSTQLRRDAAERLKTTTGSISLPSLTSAASSEPSVPPLAKRGAQKTTGPSKGWSGPPGEANAAEVRRNVHKQQAKGAKPQNPVPAKPARATEPSAASSAPRPAVRFSSQPPPAPLDSPTNRPSSEETAASDTTPLSRRMARKGTPHPSKLVKAPSLAESEVSEHGEAAEQHAGEFKEAAITNGAMEETIFVDDDFVADPPSPPGAPSPEVAQEAGGPSKAVAHEAYEDDFDVAPEHEEPPPAAPRLEEPPADEFEEASPAAEAPPPEAEDQFAAHPPAGVGGAAAAEPEVQEPIFAASPPQLEPVEQTMVAEEMELRTPPPGSEVAFEEEATSTLVPSPKASEAGATSAVAGEAVGEDAAEEALPDAEAPASPELSPSEASPAPDSPGGALTEASEPAAALLEATQEDSYGVDDFEDEDTAARPLEPGGTEPKVEPVAGLGVRQPTGDLDPVSIAQPAKQDTGAEDQGQDEYEDEYEDDFVNEAEKLGSTQGFNQTGVYEDTFEEDTFEDTVGDAAAEDDGA